MFFLQLFQLALADRALFLQLPDAALQVLDRSIGDSNFFLCLKLIALDLGVFPPQAVDRYAFFVKDCAGSVDTVFQGFQLFFEAGEFILLFRCLMPGEFNAFFQTL